MTINRIVVVGGGVAEARQGAIFAKASIAAYLRGLSDYFTEVHWFAAARYGTAEYTSELNRDRFRFTALSLSHRTLFTLDAWSGLNTLLTALDGDTALMMWVPHPFLALLTPLLRRRCQAVGVYVGNDWIREADARRATGRKFRAHLDRALMRVSLRCADVVLVRGAHVARDARQYNSRVVESEPIIAWDRCVGRVTLGRRNEPLRLLYVGKIELGKGVHVLVEAVALVHSAIKSGLTLTLTGTGSEADAVRDQIADAGLSTSVRMIGYLDDPDALGREYAAADAVVVPSIAPEGAPRVIEEALLHGVPVIASGHVVTSRVGASNAALVVPAGNAPDLAEAIRQIDAPSTRAQLRNAAIAWASTAAQLSAARQHAELLGAIRRPS